METQVMGREQPFIETDQRRGSPYSGDIHSPLISHVGVTETGSGEIPTYSKKKINKSDNSSKTQCLG